jgi:hypothetical protein
MGAQQFKAYDVEDTERTRGGPSSRWRVHDAVSKEGSERSSVFVLRRDGLDALPTELSARAGAVYARDAAVLLRLSHPNVLACLDVAADGAAMVTEPVRYSLADLLARRARPVDASPSSSPRERLPLPRCAFGWSCILVEVAAALRYCCEEHRLIHMDVTPENIYYGEDGRWKLGGFGFCRQVGAPLAWSAPGAVVLEHRAGECARGKVTAANGALFADAETRAVMRTARASASVAIEPTAPCAPEIIPLSTRACVAQVERLAAHSSDIFALGCLGLHVLLPGGGGELTVADNAVLRSAALLAASRGSGDGSDDGVGGMRDARLAALAVLHRDGAHTISAMRLPPLLGDALLKLLALDPAARPDASAFIAADCFPEAVLRTIAMVAALARADETHVLAIANDLPQALHGFPEETVLHGPLQAICRILAAHVEAPPRDAGCAVATATATATRSALVAPLLACALSLTVRLSDGAFQAKLMPVLKRFIGCAGPEALAIGSGGDGTGGCDGSGHGAAMLILLQSMPLLVAKGDSLFARGCLVPLVARSLESDALPRLRNASLRTLPAVAQVRVFFYVPLHFTRILLTV